MDYIVGVVGPTTIDSANNEVKDFGSNYTFYYEVIFKYPGLKGKRDTAVTEEVSLPYALLNSNNSDIIRHDVMPSTLLQRERNAVRLELDDTAIDDSMDHVEHVTSGHDTHPGSNSSIIGANISHNETFHKSVLGNSVNSSTTKVPVSLVPDRGTRNSSTVGLHQSSMVRDKRVPDEQRLLLKLMRSYDQSVRPVFNISTSVVVNFSLTLVQIMDMVRQTFQLKVVCGIEHINFVLVVYL